MHVPRFSKRLGALGQREVFGSDIEVDWNAFRKQQASVPDSSGWDWGGFASGVASLIKTGAQVYGQVESAQAQRDIALAQAQAQAMNPFASFGTSIPARLPTTTAVARMGEENTMLYLALGGLGILAAILFLR